MYTVLSSNQNSAGTFFNVQNLFCYFLGPSNCYKVVKMIMERSLQPVIIFSFSRRECETLALQMSKLDFNTAWEKELVDEVFKNAIDCLSDDDKQLPQVRNYWTLVTVVRFSRGNSWVINVLHEKVCFLLQINFVFLHDSSLVTPSEMWLYILSFW